MRRAARLCLRSPPGRAARGAKPGQGVAVCNPFSSSACKELPWLIRGSVPTGGSWFFLQVHVQNEPGEPSPGAWAPASREEQALVS